MTKRALTVSAAALAAAMTLAAASQAKHWANPPEIKIDLAKKYTATISTEKGDIVLELFAKEAPKTVNNFVFLAREGFYDGVAFHRVIPDFMAQGGDRNGTPAGTGGPGYQFEDEVDPAKNPHTFDGPGYLAMANAGPATNGSQFFITYKATEWLNGKHTIFGKVLSGQDVALKLVNGDAMKKVTIKEE